MSGAFIGVIVIGLLSVVVILFIAHLKAGQYENVKTTGIRVEAKIVSMEKVGASGTGNTQFKMRLEFATSEGIKSVTRREFLTPLNLIKVERNKTIPLYYLAQNPDKVWVATNELNGIE